MANTKEKLVSVFIPKTSRNDTERFVAVNGERILVQTGKTVEIPERFAEVIKNSENMRRFRRRILMQIYLFKVGLYDTERCN